jgi:hypothetical protein
MQGVIIIDITGTKDGISERHNYRAQSKQKEHED